MIHDTLHEIAPAHSPAPAADALPRIEPQAGQTGAQKRALTAALGQTLDSVWDVALPTHAHYTSTHLKAAFNSVDSRHCVVMVDVSKLLRCADRDTTDYVLPEVSHWHPGKVRGIREFLDPRQSRVPEMPYVTFSTRHRHTLLGLFGLALEGVVSFRNGQHRARYMAFAGATAIPVEVHETEAQGLALYCGVDAA